MSLRKIAIVGSGISGLAVAHTLRGLADITLYESADYFGGHTHTVDVTLPTAQGLVTHGVDTGFLVFNERTYPNLINLFAQLGVETTASDMSFSVKVPDAFDGQSLEWSGTNLDTVFAQRSNLLRPRFLKMMADVLRFNALCTRLAKANLDADMRQPLADFLQIHRFSNAFRDWYFFAHARLHLELPDRSDAAVSGRHDDPVLPQPWLDSSHQPAALVHGQRRRAPLCRKNSG